MLSVTSSASRDEPKEMSLLESDPNTTPTNLPELGHETHSHTLFVTSSTSRHEPKEMSLLESDPTTTPTDLPELGHEDTQSHVICNVISFTS